MPGPGKLQLVGEGIGVCCQGKSLFGQHGGSSMVAMAAAFIGGKAGNDHIRFKVPNGPDHIGENRFFIPEGKGLFRGFGVAEILCPAEILLGTIFLTGFQQFLGA